jgi:hypothetical protein
MSNLALERDRAHELNLARAISRKLKQNGTFDRIRNEVIKSVLEEETLRTFAQFAVMSRPEMIRKSIGKSNEAVDRVLIKRMSEKAIEREISESAWKVLTNDVGVSRMILEEVYKEKMAAEEGARVSGRGSKRARR